MFGHVHVEFYVGVEGVHDFMEVGAQVFFEGVFQVVGGPAGFHEEVFHGVQFCRAGEMGGLEEVFAGGPVEAEVGCLEGRIGVYGASSSPMGRLARAIQKY